VLMRVGHRDRREEVVRLACEDKRPSVRARALVTLGLGGPLAAEDAEAVAAPYDESRPIERHAALFALGMAGAPQLAALAESADQETRRGARWWLAQGPALEDGDAAR
jgi:hypothetical protein